jgi:hypothetical protein
MTYFELRRLHFTATLRDALRGLDKTIIGLVAVLQFILTAIVALLLMALAHGFALLADPATGVVDRALVVAAWQASSWMVLRALREAALMPRARGFMDALPIGVSARLWTDIVLAAFAYSFLWAPMLWALFAPAAAPRDTSHDALPFAELALLSLCANIAWLRGAARQTLVAFLALGVFAIAPGAGAVPELARLGATVLGATTLWTVYLPGARRAAGPARAGAFADSMSLRSGLVLPLLAHELGANLFVRLGIIAATLAACLAVIRLRTNDTSSASVVVFVSAMAALALFRLPALIRNTLLSKLHFLRAHPGFPRRMRFAAYAVPTLLFAAAVIAAWPFDRSGTAMRDAVAFSSLYVAGVAATRAAWAPANWLVPVVGAVMLIILSAMT